jgi:hypothetical protein
MSACLVVPAGTGSIDVMSKCMVLLWYFSVNYPAAAASVVAQPLLQLLGPAVKHCLQQQQQQWQGAVSSDGVQPPLSIETAEVVELFLALLHNVLTHSKQQVLPGSGRMVCLNMPCQGGCGVPVECVLVV